MRGYIARRIVGLVIVLFGVSVLSFTFGALAPGDPARIDLERVGGEPPTEEQVEVRRAELGLDRPLPVQYLAWLGDAARGDLGQSWALREDVASALGRRIPRTILLAVLAAGLTLLLAIPLGAVAVTGPPLVVHQAREHG